MATLEGIQAQLSSIWEAAVPQLEVMVNSSKEIAINSYEGIEYWTNEAAKYVFGKDSSLEHRNAVLANFVTPLTMATVGTAVFISFKAVRNLLIISALFSLYVAAKNGYLSREE